MSTFYDLFTQCAEQWPQNTALEIQLRDGVESYTYADARRMAESVGRWLTEHRLEPGSRLAILAANHPRWVAAYLGTIAAGHVAVPLDIAFHADQVAKLLKDSGSAILFTDAKHFATAQKAVQDLRVEIVLTENLPTASDTTRAHSASRATLDSMFAAGPGGFKAIPAPQDAVAALLYTSGTTADPKGVMLTHANLMGEVKSVFATLDIGPDDALLGILPMFHVLAQMANLMLPLTQGARVVYLETLNTTELLRALQERDITAFAVVPQFFYLIHEKIFKEIAARGELATRLIRVFMGVNRWLRRLGLNAGRLFFGKIHATFGSKMRYLVTGGSRFDPAISGDYRDFGIDIMNAYGLTETSAAACLNLPDNIVIGSVGPALPGVEVRTLEPQPQEDGPPVGEIAIKGAIVMKGYWNRPDATAAVLRDGWLLTGDLGYLDSGGNLFITGRRKELIVLANGKNIYPEEIETHYLKSPFIKEICVMGLEATPGDPTTERLYAVVVPNFDALKERKIVNAKEVIRYDIEGLSTQMPSTKRVGAYEIWQEDLPRTTTRKLKRFEIEKKVRANQRTRKPDDAEISTEKPLTDEEQMWLARNDVQQALAILRERARNSPEVIRPADNLELDLGLDSMQRVELLSALEEKLGGDLEESQLAEIYMVRELVDAVLESAASGKNSGGRPQFAGWQAILGEEPTDPDVLAIAKQQPTREAFLYVLSRFVQIVALDRFDLHCRGLEKLPKNGPYIICSNHQSYLDPPILASVLPFSVFRDLFEVGTSEIFGSGFMRWLARWVRVVVVDPDANLVPAMRAGAFGLRHGRILMLYPEGERSIDGTPRNFKKGAAILSIHLQVPIVPVAIEGFYDAWPRSQKFQGFFPLKIALGDPIYPPPADEASEAAYEKLTSELKAKVVDMWEGMRKKAVSTREGAEEH
jgi:long-chain acyl-CoA synthetase